MLGQTVGFPVPEGGAGELAQALARRFASRGRRDPLPTPRSTAIEVDARPGDRRAHRATASGSRARRAVVADVVGARTSTAAWSADEDLPGRTVRAMRRVPARPGHGQGRLGPRRPGAVGVARRRTPRAPSTSPTPSSEMTEALGQVAAGVDPGRPFLLAGQMTTTDPTRSPAGTESMWAYTHVPQQTRARRRRRRHPRRLGRRRLRALRRPDAGPDRGAGARLRRPGPRPPGARAARARGARRQPGRRRASTAAPPSCTSSWSSGRSPASAAPRPRSPGSTSARPRRTPAAACTAPPGMNAARAALAHARLPHLRRTPRLQENR